MYKLTLKQYLFIREYFESRSATQAAFKVYCCKNRNVAGVIGYQNLRKLNIRLAIDRVLNQAGISEESIALSLKRKID